MNNVTTIGCASAGKSDAGWGDIDVRYRRNWRGS